MNRLEVKASKLHFILVILLGLMFFSMALLISMDGLSKGHLLGTVIAGFILLTFYGFVVWLFRRGHLNSVKYFSDEGLVRNDGRSFAWVDLSRVINQIGIYPSLNRKVYWRGKGLWRTEIQFKSGESAWLIPTKISNYGEVSAFVRNLPCEHTEIRV